MRILFTGNRDWNDMASVFTVMSFVKPGTTVVHGDHWEGADMMVDRIARTCVGVTVEPHPVPREEWRRLGRKAGPMRNSAMVALGADVCVAFGDLERGGKRTGTGDCVEKARAAGVPVVRVVAGGLAEALNELRAIFGPR